MVNASPWDVIYEIEQKSVDDTTLIRCKRILKSPGNTVKRVSAMFLTNVSLLDPKPEFYVPPTDWSAAAFCLIAKRSQRLVTLSQHFGSAPLEFVV